MLRIISNSSAQNWRKQLVEEKKTKKKAAGRRKENKEKSSWKKKRRKNTEIFCDSWMKNDGEPAVRIGEGEINGKLGVGCSKAE